MMKVFWMLTNKQKSTIKDLSNLFNVRYRIIKPDSAGCEGWSFCEENMILISNMKMTDSRLISITLHEICHILAFKNNKFNLYHHPSGMVLTKEHIRAIIRTGWRAEKYVDCQAEKMMKKLFPRRKFVQSYNLKDDDDKEWYNKHFLNYYRELLAST